MRGHVLLALLGSVGLAVGFSALIAYPSAARQSDEPVQPAQPASPPPPAVQPGQNAEEVQRILRGIQEEAAKHAATPQPPAVVQPVVPPLTPPATAPATAPASGKSNGGAKGEPTDASKKDQTNGKGGATKSTGSGRDATKSPRTGGGKDSPRVPNNQPGAGAAPKANPMAPSNVNMTGMAQPGGAGGGEASVVPPVETAFSDDGKNFVFNFTDATELAVIVQFVQQAMNLQIIATDSGLIGQKVVLMTPITVTTEQVLPFLTSLLEAKGYTMTRDTRGIYIISPSNQINVSFGRDPNNSTRVIPTPGLKPMAIQGVINTLLNANRGAGGGGSASQPQFLDDLGVIIITDTPNNIAMVESAVKVLVEEQAKVTIQRFPVVNVAAASARDRVIELLGSGILSRPVGIQGGANPAGIAQGASGSMSNIPERLSLDASTNALLFRGRADESILLVRLLQLVDVPNQLDARWYNIGSRAAETVVDAARQQQLGDVRYFEGGESGGGNTGATGLTSRGRVGGQPNVPGFQQQGQSDVTGAGFVVYPDAGGFIYRGTTQQHARVEKLIKDLGPLSEFDDTITYEFIKLKHSKATDLATTVTDLLNNSTASGNSGSLLSPRLGQGSRRDTATSRTRDRERQVSGDADPRAAAAAAVAGEVTEINSEDVHVLADEPTNQVVVKAPKRLQPQLKALINKLDLRRPQVFIEAKIVAISTSDDFRLSAEVQQIIGQFALNTNFGLGTIGTAASGTTGSTGTLLDRKNASTNLSGLTTALIRSKDVPFIINAIQRNTDSRIVASPQVLVDDNEEATVESLDQQPTLTTTLGSGTTSNNTTQSFGGFEPAGPRLTVKPQISEGGYMKLEYEIELSSFTGESTVAGVPPPKQENRVKADSVTVPSDTTIVVGGLTFEQTNNTVSGIPLLQDIPLVGNLFKDTRKSNRNITLYVFITPKIMRDPSFADLRLLTTKPLSDSRLAQELPPSQHERIDVIDPARAQTETRMEDRIVRQKEEFEIVEPEPKNKKGNRKSGTMYE